MTDSIDKIKKDADARMAKSLETLKNDLGKLRAGRAHPALLDQIRVDYYGQRSPLSQVANIVAIVFGLTAAIAASLLFALDR